MYKDLDPEIRIRKAAQILASGVLKAMRKQNASSDREILHLGVVKRRSYDISENNRHRDDPA